MIITVKKAIYIFLGVSFLSLGGCSSSGNDSDKNNEENPLNDVGNTTPDNPTNFTGDISQNPSNPKRVKTVSYDYFQDGSIERIDTFSYDNDGRITSRQEDYPQNPEFNSLVRFIYENGQLTRKYLVGNEETEDVHTYVDGVLTASKRAWSGEHTYLFNANGQLMESTGDQFGFLDGCSSPTSNDDNVSYDDTRVLPSFAYSYAGNEVDTIASTDGTLSIQFGYENDKLKTITELQTCSIGDDLLTELTITYNSINEIDRIQIIELDPVTRDVWNIDSLESQRDETGRAVGTIQTENRDEITTVTRSFAADGLPSSDSVVFTGFTDTFFSTPNSTLTYTYEDGPCEINYSSDPTTLLLLDALTAQTLPSNALDCGYPLDRTDF